jgi:hypothetical protein
MLPGRAGERTIDFNILSLCHSGSPMLFAIANCKLIRLYILQHHCTPMFMVQLHVLLFLCQSPNKKLEHVVHMLGMYSTFRHTYACSIM